MKCMGLVVSGVASVVLSLSSAACGYDNDGILWVPTEYATINTAIQVADPVRNDEVRVLPDSDPSTPEVDPYNESVLLDKAILVTSWDPAVEGPNRDAVVIDGQHTYVCVQIEHVASPGATLQGFTLSSGSAYSGGGVFCSDAKAAIVDCRIDQCTAVLCGGGIYIESDSDVTLTGCTITGNWTQYGSGGGIYVTDSNLTLDGCTVSDNGPHDYYDTDFGGGIYATGSSVVEVTGGSSVQRNTAGDGGGMYCQCAEVILQGSTVADNTATGASQLNEGHGGGISMPREHSSGSKTVRYLATALSCGAAVSMWPRGADQRPS